MSFQPIIQGFAAVIIIGVGYSLWRTTHSYGGLVGGALKWIGLGMIFFSVEALSRALGSLSFLDSLGTAYAELAHNVLLLLGLASSGIGFSKLTKIAK